MASEDRKTENAASGSGHGEKLDFFSPNFDPLLALSQSSVQPPVTEARAYDNIHVYQSARSNLKKPGSSKQSSSSARGCREMPEAGFQRRFKEHQMPIKVERPVVAVNNVLAKMESAVDGPMGVLKRCREERLRVKVLIRHSHGIRGYCLAYVTAFDKFWNLALEDVQEVWTRPIKRKIPATAGKFAITTPTVAAFPEIRIVKSDKKTETCERSVRELLVRGEQVVLISVT